MNTPFKIFSVLLWFAFFIILIIVAFFPQIHVNKEIYLLHLSDGNSDEARFKHEIMALTGKPVIVCQKG